MNTSNYKVIRSGQFGDVEKTSDMFTLNADCDILDEVLVGIFHPKRSEATTAIPVDSLEINYFSFETGQHIFDKVLMDSLNQGFPEDSLKNSWFGCKMKFLPNSFNTQPDFNCSHFALGVWGEGISYKKRYVLLYKRGDPPERIAKIQTAAYPSTGIWHHLSDGTLMFTFCGSPPCNDLDVPVRYVTHNGEERTDVLNDSLGGWIQVSSEGEIKWVTQIDTSGGGCYIYGQDTPDKPLIGVFHQDAYVNDHGPNTIIVKLDPNNGSIMDSTHVSGNWISFLGESVKESGYIGAVSISEKKIQLITQDGNLGSVLRIPNEVKLYNSPVLRIDNNNIGFMVHRGRKWGLLYDFSGNLLAATQGDFFSEPMRINTENSRKDLNTFRRGERIYLEALEPGPKFWFFWRWRWLVLALIFPPALVFGVYFAIGWMSEKARTRRELEDANLRLAGEVKVRTKDLTELNASLKKEIDLRTKAEKLATLNSERLEAIFDGLEDGVITAKLNGEITRANEAIYRILEIEQKKLIGGSISSIVDDNSEAFRLAVEKTIGRGEKIQGYMVETTTFKGNKRVLLLTAMPLIGGNSDSEAIVVVRDYTKTRVLEEKVKVRSKYGRLIGKSRKMQALFETIDAIADTEISVFITGETGSGKELIAEAIHEKGSRTKGPFVAISCPEFSEFLIIDELFGHKKGAFTGALSDKKGLVEIAQNGTLFLDEIGEIKPQVQAKLLRFLEAKEFKRIGGTKYRKSNARIIAATNKDFKGKNDTEFRVDLYYRLAGYHIKSPALREKISDIHQLTDSFLKEFCKEYKKSINQISPEAMELLLNHDWPGNVRDLKNCIEGAVITCTSDVIHPSDFPPETLRKRVESKNLAEAKETNESSPQILETEKWPWSREYMIRILELHKWNKKRVYEKYKIPKATFYYWLKKYNIK